MVALASAVDASEEVWHLSAPLSGGTPLFLVQSELVRVQNRTVRLSMRDPVDTLRCRVIRGVGFTTPATHAQGVTLTPYYGEFGPAPIDTGGGGGGGLPSQWTADSHGDVVIAPDDPNTGDPMIQIVAPTDFFNNGSGQFLALIDEVGRVVHRWDVSGDVVLRGSVGGGPSAVVASAPDTPDTTGFYGSDGMHVTNTALSNVFQVIPTGYMRITTASGAPADGDLSPTQLAFWFDSSNGAAKLMLKGKTANGTVVTGSVNLI
jgi:hypothetical protein